MMKNREKKTVKFRFGKYFLQKTLGIPENDIEEHQKCNRKHFPLENIRDSRKIVKTQRWKMSKMQTKQKSRGKKNAEGSTGDSAFFV